MPGGPVTLIPGLSASLSPTFRIEPTRTAEPLPEQEASTLMRRVAFWDEQIGITRLAARNPSPCHRMAQPAPTVR